MSYLGVTLETIKTVMEIMLYIALIHTSFKAAQALNIYINKNS